MPQNGSMLFQGWIHECHLDKAAVSLSLSRYYPYGQAASG